MTALTLGVIVAVAMATGSSGGGRGPVSSGPAPYLGLQMESVPIDRVLVAGVVGGSPAANAGVEPGDLVVGVDGHSVASPGDVEANVAGKRPGDVLSIQVERGLQTLTVQARLTRQTVGYP
jgi:S1-C subfamily serine protease